MVNNSGWFRSITVFLVPALWTMMPRHAPGQSNQNFWGRNPGFSIFTALPVTEPGTEGWEHCLKEWTGFTTVWEWSFAYVRQWPPVVKRFRDFKWHMSKALSNYLSLGGKWFFPPPTLLSLPFWWPQGESLSLLLLVGLKYISVLAYLPFKCKNMHSSGPEHSASIT